MTAFLVDGDGARSFIERPEAEQAELRRDRCGSAGGVAPADRGLTTEVGWTSCRGNTSIADWRVRSAAATRDA